MTLKEAARVAGRRREAVLRPIRGGRIEVTVRNGVQLVAVGELIRIGWLDRDGRPPALPDKLGLPLLMPLDPEQMLSADDVM